MSTVLFTQAYESKEQLKVVSGDLTHLNDINKVRGIRILNQLI